MRIWKIKFEGQGGLETYKTGSILYKNSKSDILNKMDLQLLQPLCFSDLDSNLTEKAEEYSSQYNCTGCSKGKRRPRFVLINRFKKEVNSQAEIEIAVTRAKWMPKQLKNGQCLPPFFFLNFEFLLVWLSKQKHEELPFLHSCQCYFSNHFSIFALNSLELLSWVK